MVKVNIKKLLGTASLIFLGIVMIVGIAIFVAALQEQPPEHSLDFQDTNITKLSNPIMSVGDGLVFARDRANKWRKDAVLTGIQIVSEGRGEIEKKSGIINYKFEFKYINEQKPAGTLSVSISTKTNSIELVTASHDGDNKSRIINEMDDSSLDKSINKIYDTAINAIGIGNILQYKQPFIRVSINSDVSQFEVGSSEAKSNIIEYELRVNTKTFKVIKGEVN